MHTHFVPSAWNVLPLVSVGNRIRPSVPSPDNPLPLGDFFLPHRFPSKAGLKLLKRKNVSYSRCSAPDLPHDEGI